MGCSYSEALACSCLMGSTKCEVAGEPAVHGSQHAIRFPAPSLEGRQALSCMMQQLLPTHGQATSAGTPQCSTSPQALLPGCLPCPQAAKLSSCGMLRLRGAAAFP